MRLRFGLVTLAFGTAVLLGWTMLGGLDTLNATVRDAVLPRWGGMAYQLALLSTFVLIGGLLDAPLDLYNTFRIEQRFGFNRTSLRLYLIDAAKGLLVGALIGLPMAALVLWIMAGAGAWWWLWAWAAWVAFQLLILVLYPTVIAPLFNKFEPLPDEALKQRVQALNEFLSDIYHGQAILKAGIVPPERVLANAQYRREMQGVDVPGGIYAHIAGVDLVRAGAGEFYVVRPALPDGVPAVGVNSSVTPA